MKNNGGLWHCTGGSDQNYPQEKEMQEGKMVAEALQIAEKKREAKSREGKIHTSECRVPKNSKEK